MLGAGSVQTGLCAQNMQLSNQLGIVFVTYVAGSALFVCVSFPETPVAAL